MRMKVKLWAWLLVVVVVVLVIVIVLSPVLFASIAYPLPEKYRASLAKYGQEFGIDPNLVAAVIHVESHWKESARSPVGATGMSQFMPSTAVAVAKRLGVSPFKPQDLVSNPDMAIRFCAYYVSEAIKRYGGSVRYALIAYNGGGGAVNIVKAGGKSSTTGYANKVTATWEAYKTIYGEWYKNPSTPVTEGNAPEFKIEPKRDLDILKTIPIVQFWQNVINTKPADKPATTDVENFWQNIVPENP